MRLLVLITLCGVVALQPALARSAHHRHGRHGVSHTARGGMPITAQSDSIRINAVGEVISKPTPVTRKEQNFNARARDQLLKQPPSAQPTRGSGGDLSLRP